MNKNFTVNLVVPDRRKHQIWRIMRITTLILIAAIMQVSAASYAQKISLSEKKAPLAKIFIKISRQSGFDFMVTGSTLKDTKPVTIDVKNMEISEVLKTVFQNQPVTYILNDKIVMVSRKELTLVDKVKDFFAVPVDVHGRVTDSTGTPLVGANVRIKSNRRRGIVTDSNGEFNITNVEVGAILEVSYISYISQEVTITRENAADISITLKVAIGKLQEVAVVSTGYQTIPKERATGSFVLMDSALLSRRVGPDILDRLDGVTSGLIFNRGINDGSNKSDITIRGRSTIFANPNPLIVLDNFPYDGDLNSINPNDIQNISVLKDAAAASIWGVRAGNGVIVITTKKGKRGGEPLINFNTNLTIGEKPNPWYPYQMSSSDYITMEKFLFDNSYYDNTISNGYGAISPAVALMNKLRNNQISTTDYNSQINALKQVDVRDDMDKYLYRKSANQEYSLSVSGGGTHQKYFISGGFDRNAGSQTTDNYSRYTINANNTFNLLKDKLELFTSLSFSKSNTGSNASGYTPYTPYDQLADKNGNALPVVGNQTLRASYVDTAGNGKLLDWRYYPLNENKTNRNADLTSYRFLTGVTYRIIDHLRLQLNYQYEQDQNNDNRTYDQNSFYTRDMINRFSSIASSTGTVSRVIPIGNIVDQINSGSSSQYARSQLAYENNINGLHAISAIAGFEIKDYKDNVTSQRYYGYDPSTASNANGSINPLAYYNAYFDPFGLQTIPTAPTQSGSTDRYRSYYANASYTYNNKYIFTASARKDETNIFGVTANQKGVPLWSTGLAWNLSNESFYHFDAVPYLKVRATYGYNGNADKTTSAYLTANALYYNIWNTLYSTIINPPNPSLGWEKIENINLGVDFSARNNWLSGSVEYYRKKGMNLIGYSPIAPQTGITTFKGNTADTKTNGVDVVANFDVIKQQPINWKINVLYSYSLDKITSYKLNQSNNGGIVNSNYSNPLVGYPYYAVFAFKSAGLDASGNPRGYLNGQISTDYTAIYNSTNASELIYKGSGTPTSFGSIRNTLTMQQWELSANVIYKFGYYFRRTGMFSGSNYSYAQGDFDKRWQKAGDELHTTVPSLVYPANPYRDIFYSSSEDVVEKGDNIRLQDIKLSYQLNPRNFRRLPFKSLQIYSYVNNIGILWRANKKGIDPDAGTQLTPAVRTFSIGLNANF